MVYSTSTNTELKQLAKTLNVSVDELEKLLAHDRATGGGSLPEQLSFFKGNPEPLTVFINRYNLDHPSAPITPGTAQKKQYAIIGGAVVLALVVAWVVWKKVLKK